MHPLDKLQSESVNPDSSENLLPFETNGISRQFDPSALNAVYFDNRLQAALPRFAVIDASKTEGCKITLQKTVDIESFWDFTLPWRVKDIVEVENNFEGFYSALKFKPECMFDESSKLSTYIQPGRWVLFGCLIAFFLLYIQKFASDYASIENPLMVLFFGMMLPLLGFSFLLLFVNIIPSLLPFKFLRPKTFVFKPKNYLTEESRKAVAENMDDGSTGVKKAFLIFDATEKWSLEETVPTEVDKAMLLRQDGSAFRYIRMVDFATVTT